MCIRDSLYSALLAPHLPKICFARLFTNSVVSVYGFDIDGVGSRLRRVSLDPERSNRTCRNNRYGDAFCSAVNFGISTDPPGDCPRHPGIAEICPFPYLAG